MKKKTVKAWAILDDKGAVIAVEPQEARPTRFSIGTWGFVLEKHDNRAVPCTITYSL